MSPSILKSMKEILHLLPRKQFPLPLILKMSPHPPIRKEAAGVEPVVTSAAYQDHEEPKESLGSLAAMVRLVFL